ncbi:hypothetical protein XJ32_01180 [Helicobacter bilis]|uniref:Uncharacterized protein n=1 Tax=Helicobacter bilis TaxID=37372 RepID=A0A1Q2LET2_9HELI|nr:hypothetical protein [Helicobacter bilis]AQQ58940.1 hypothetical protein XJ32_01180 [Helicobacter bilis]
MRKATTATQVTNMGKNQDGVALGNATYERYKDSMGKVSNEISHNFSLEIYNRDSTLNPSHLFKVSIH